jgi:hypothetical protein
MMPARSWQPCREVLTASIVSFFTSITVAELKTRKLIGSHQKVGSNQNSSRPSPRRRLIGSSQRARSNQIQSQQCAILHIHHRCRAKDKDSHWRARSNWIQSKHHTVLKVYHLCRAKDKMFIGSRQRARANQNQSQHCAVLFRQRSSLAHVRKQDPVRFKAIIVLFLGSITVAELKTRKLIGSRQRVRSNQIQSQHCAIIYVHHHCRAKNKEAHWLTSESKIQSDS